MFIQPSKAKPVLNLTENIHVIVDEGGLLIWVEGDKVPQPYLITAQYFCWDSDKDLAYHLNNLRDHIKRNGG